MRLKLIALCGCASGVLAAAASAQTVDEAPASVTSGGLQEIVITARKTSEDLQRAPIAVTPITQDAIASRGIKDPVELQSLLPAIQFKVATTPTAVIRGLGTYNNQPGVDSAVAYSVDGTYLSHHPALPPVLFDLARVEVVRGPQGTLFGRNSNAGGLGFITNRPTYEFGGMLAATVGNHGTLGSEAMINLPVSDSMALRASFASNHHDPYYESGQDDANNYAGRIRLLLEPADRLEFIATVDYARTKTSGQGFTYCPKNNEFFPGQNDCQDRPFDPYLGLIDFDTSKSSHSIKNLGAYGELNYDAGIGDLTSITSYRWYDLETFYILEDLDYLPSSKNKFFTQEVRIASKPRSYVNWVAGIFYSRETMKALESYFFFGQRGIDSSFDEYKATSKAVFGQVTVPIVDALRVTGGLRYTDERKRASGTATSFFVDPPSIIQTSASMREKRLTWKAGFDYDISPTSFAYVSASNGFKSGGVNNAPPGSGLETYDPETIKAFQVGAKNRFSDNRIQVNAEAFYYDYKGYQTFYQFGEGFNTFFLTINSQKATFYGGEIESSILVSDAGKLDLSVALLHAEFDEFITPAENLSGNELQSAPKYTFTASYQHTFELAGGDRLIAQADSRLVDGHYTANSNAPETYQNTYTRSGASVTYETAGLALTAFVRNIENKGIMMAYTAPIFRQAGLGAYEPPRTIGVTARINW